MTLLTDRRVTPRRAEDHHHAVWAQACSYCPFGPRYAHDHGLLTRIERRMVAFGVAHPWTLAALGVGFGFLSASLLLR